MLRPGKVSRPFVPATFTSELLRRRTTRTLESQVAVMLSTLYLALCPYWGCWCSMSCRGGAHGGRRKVQVVNNDVAPVCGLSSFIVRKSTVEIDCSSFYLFIVMVAGPSQDQLCDSSRLRGLSSVRIAGERGRVMRLLWPAMPRQRTASHFP